MRVLHVLTHPCVQICDRVPDQLPALCVPGAVPGPAQRVQRGLRHLQVVRRPLRGYPPRGHEDSPPSPAASLYITPRHRRQWSRGRRGG
nr:MAG TPA: hypothetical protein [Caudoviricetes sp.]